MANRPVCDVLQELRECFKTYSFGIIPSLVEELQTIVNRMEASLYDKRDFTRMQDQLKRATNRNKELNEQEASLNDRIKLAEAKLKGLRKEIKQNGG